MTRQTNREKRSVVKTIKKIIDKNTMVIKVCRLGCEHHKYCRNILHGKLCECPKYRRLANIGKSPKESEDIKNTRLYHLNKSYIKNKNSHQKYSEYTDDLLDSKGEDISDEEFIENEQFWECL